MKCKVFFFPFRTNYINASFQKTARIKKYFSGLPLNVRSALVTRVTNKRNKFSSSYHNHFGFWRHSEITANKTREEKTCIKKVNGKIYCSQNIKLLKFIDITCKGTAIHKQAWRGPEVEAPTFLDNKNMKLVRLSVLRTVRLYPTATHFWQRHCRLQGHSASERLC